MAFEHCISRSWYLDILRESNEQQYEEQLFKVSEFHFPIKEVKNKKQAVK